jgi:hypothetical protein
MSEAIEASHIDDAAIALLPPGALFYPCSGPDIESAVSLFRRRVSEFWFVDPKYNSSWLPDLSGFVIESESTSNHSGTTIWSQTSFEVRVYTRECRSLDDGSLLRVNFCEGRGYNALRVLIAAPQVPLSVFYYRGDSPGESGSGFYWLRKPRLRNLLRVLQPNGLIVTDGSNADRRFRRFHTKNSDSCTQRPMPGPEAQERAKPFAYHGREFKCIGYTTPRYGPTLVWQVTPLANRATTPDHTGI